MFASSSESNNGSAFTGGASRVKPRGQLDLSTSVNVNKQFTVSLDAYNLTNAIRQEFENDPRLARRADYDGRSFTLTVRATF